MASLISSETKPIILQIGISHLFKISHIPGSQYVGPASSNEGLEAVRNKVKSVNRGTRIVLYCGCCPWDHCPNTRPAFRALREMGFTKVNVLYLEHTFGQDWISKGFPVEKGE